MCACVRARLCANACMHVYPINEVRISDNLRVL